MLKSKCFLRLSLTSQLWPLESLKQSVTGFNHVTAIGQSVLLHRTVATKSQATKNLINNTGCSSCNILRHDNSSSEPGQQIINTTFKRHCSVCTFIDGNVPPGFRTRPPWRMLFFGSDDFSVRHLDALVQIGLLSESHQLVDSLEVVCNSSKSKKPSAVFEYANSKGLKIHTWPIRPEYNKYDVGVIVSFGHLIPAEIIHMFPYGILNVHPSLLPKWRGASPIFHTVLNGDEETGVSIMEIRPKRFDIGPLLMQQKFYVPKRVTSFQLSDILASLGAHMLLHTLENLPWLEIAEKEQATTGITYAHKITPIMANVDWSRQTCYSIDCQYRALHEIVRLRSEYNGQTIHLLDMVNEDAMDPSLVQELSSPNLLKTPAGWPYYSKRHKLLCIRCKDGWVAFKNIVINKAMDAQSFYNGYLGKKENRGKIFKSLPNRLNEDIHRERIRLRSS